MDQPKPQFIFRKIHGRIVPIKMKAGQTPPPKKTGNLGYSFTKRVVKPALAFGAFGANIGGAVGLTHILAANIAAERHTGIKAIMTEFDRVADISREANMTRFLKKKSADKIVNMNSFKRSKSFFSASNKVRAVAQKIWWPAKAILKPAGKGFLIGAGIGAAIGLGRSIGATYKK